jgi:predicted extracellular nuclease
MRKLLLFPAALLLAACGGDSNDPGDPEPVVATVLQIQSGLIETNLVEVTARVMAVSQDGDRLWIADGLTAVAREGVEVLRGSGAGALAASVGDLVTVVGRVREFGQGAGLTVTQISDSPEITVVSAAAGPPVPITGLNPSVITMDPVIGASLNGELYEGVLVRLTDLEVTSTSPFTLSDGDVSFAAGAQVIPLNDPVGTCYQSVTGIWNYDVITDKWIIVPTVAGLVAEACPT